MSTVPPAPSSPPPWSLPSWPEPRQPARWPGYVSLAVALVAVGVAIGAWLRPLPNSKPIAAPTYTDQQVSAAKVDVCAAFDKVHHALVLSSGRNGGDDPTAVLAVATSGRQALDSGSRYLSTKLSEEPAAPSELATAVQKLADLYQELAISYLDGLTNSDAELQPLLNGSDDAASTIDRQCK